jgi:hypothetical protein
MLDHYWQDLPGPHWFAGARIYKDQVARAHDGAVFVELGSWKGRSTSFMGVEIANSGKAISFFAVDHWRGSDEAAHRADPDLAAGRLYDVFLSNIAPIRDRVTPLRSDSSQAAAKFEEGSVDFIYVDAEHTYAGVTRDLEAWWPRLRSGGVIAGDDWDFQDENHANEFGIRRAVEQFAGRFGIVPEVQAGDPHADWRQWLLRKP